MRISINVPDDILSEIAIESGYLHMNRTQYIIRSCSQMISADKFLRNQPDIKNKITELTDMLSDVGRTIQD